MDGRPPGTVVMKILLQDRPEKLSIPGLKAVFPRERLFNRIDSLRNGSAIWITGAPGAGKTTLVASYVAERRLPCLWYQVDGGDGDAAGFFRFFSTAARSFSGSGGLRIPAFSPECGQDVTVFARMFFREMFLQIPAPLLIAFDDCHEVEDDSPFFEVLRAAVGESPAGITTVFMSRHEPPAVMYRLIMNEKLSLIDPAELRLDEEEAMGIVCARTAGEPDAEQVRHLHKYTDGWAAGLALMAESPATGMNPRMPGERSRHTVFSYFAGEIFDRMPVESRELLMKTAFLPTVTDLSAGALTGNDGAGSVLAALARRNCFVGLYPGARPAYRYHPLFRDFLLSRAGETYSPERIRHLKNRSAGLLEKDGLFDDAFRLYAESDDWKSAVAIVRKQALFMLDQGRYVELESWLRLLPAGVLESSPWMLFYMGMCLLFTGPMDALEYFERAYRLFPATSIVGRFAAWSGAVNSIIYAWDDFRQLDFWIDEMDRMKRVYPFLPVARLKYSVAASMFGALVYRRPYHRDMEKWMRRAQSAARSSHQVAQRMLICYQLITYFLWSGEFSRARLIMDEVRSEARREDAMPVVRIMSDLVTALYSWLAMADFEACRRAVSDGLKRAAESGVHLLDNQLLGHGVAGALTSHDLSRAEAYLDRLSSGISPQRRLERSFYHFLASWRALLAGDIPLAGEHADVRIADTLGAVLPEALQFQARAAVAVEEGRYDIAIENLNRAREAGRGRLSATTSFFRHLLMARIHRDRGRRNEMVGELRRAMKTGREHSLTTTPLWQPPVMSALCLEALREGIEVEYVKELIRKRGLVPESPPLDIEEWPWRLRVFTLGRFDVVIDGRPLRFSGKIQHKPLELLKVLIALGGQDIPDIVITDSLWPDTDGDRAHRSLITTIYRLRKLTGCEEAVVFQNRRISLDRRYWWVDAWAVEILLERLEDAVERGSAPERVEQLLRDVHVLYSGEFLDGESLPPVVMARREHLCRRLLRCHGSAGEFLESLGEWKKAVDIYQKAIEVDALAEEFYQRLMISYRNEGRVAEAITVYERCRRVLGETFGIEPSGKTVEIYRSLSGRT